MTASTRDFTETEAMVCTLPIVLISTGVGLVAAVAMRTGTPARCGCPAACECAA